VTIDTSLLVYAIDTADAEKHDTVAALLKPACRAGHGRVFPGTGRVLSGGYPQGSPLFRGSARPSRGLAGTVRRDHRGAEELSHAIDGLRRHQMTFSDAVLWATAQEAGVTVLLTEDFQDQAVVEGVRFVNPFTHPDLSQLLSE
jgi:predicted nucleic acid-binding protein